MLAALTLAGCGQGGDDLMDDYVARVANVLDAEPAPVDPMALPSYPRPRQLRQPVPDIRIDLLDAWALRGCEVFKLLGERNSILGKVAEPEIRLDYERRLLTLLPQCLGSDIEIEDDLRAELESALAAKRSAFPVHLWNASVANPDYAAYWTGGSEPFAAEDTIDTEGYKAAQSTLSQLVESPMESTGSDWLGALERMGQYPMGGHSLQSMRVAIQRLEQAERLLRAAAEDRRLCPMGPALKELGFARNVMVNIFTGEVQPWLVTVDQRFLAGFDPLSRIHDTLPIQNEPMADYVGVLQAWHDRYRLRIRQQVDAWQALFAACGSQATSAG
ncbi:hypothetical protein GCM10007392_03020 [Saccharospirillum salsuginis]|uniref:DUF3080 domain-containing protein n=1 Tax=Saccharospirillum salsuginis TaxID=418750 RepID=A0A918K0L9_9GAMM|nr:hypothetical protein GCM10007392_03020 [Saccharospirillum salsuginis]